MAAPSAERARHLRAGDGQGQRVTAFELFFDLVFVFAVTLLSHLVIDRDLSPESIAQAAFLLVVVWWAWIYTTWMVNWFDPRSVPVRIILMGVALASLLMSAAIPTAFTGHAALFADAYVALQLGRNVSAMLLLGRHEPLRPVFERIVAWNCASAIRGVAGAQVNRADSAAVWGVALGVGVREAPAPGSRPTPWRLSWPQRQPSPTACLEDCDASTGRPPPLRS